MDEIKIPAGIYYTTETAANALTADDSYLRRLCRSGEVDSIPVGGRARLIPRREVRRLKKRLEAGLTLTR
jgi:excisionase family DNA binding protein